MLKGWDVAFRTKDEKENELEVIFGEIGSLTWNKNRSINRFLIAEKHSEYTELMLNSTYMVSKRLQLRSAFQ